MNVPVEYIVCKIGILKKAVIAMFFILAVSIFFDKGFAFGVLVGGCIALANFSLLSKHILQMRELPIKKAQKFIIVKFLLMYAIMAIALWVGRTKSVETFFGVALGLLIIKIAVFVENLKKKNVLVGTN